MRRGNQLDQKGIFGVSKGNTADGLWKGGHSKNCVHDPCHSPVQHSLIHMFPVVEGGWVLESGVWSRDLERGQLKTVKRHSLKGQE